MKSRAALAHRVRERENKRGQQTLRRVKIQTPAVCVTQCELGGHLGSAGNDAIDISSEEGDQKKVRAK